MKKAFLITSLLLCQSFFLVAQNPIEIIPADCNSASGFTMFLLNRAKPKIFSTHIAEEKRKNWDHKKMIVQNTADELRLVYTNIFGQTIDTTFTNAKELTSVKLCVTKFIDFPKASIIEEAIETDEKWILNSFWGQQSVESEKLILKPKKEVLQYKYFNNRKLIKRGEIPLTTAVIERIALFERKIYRLQHSDNSCTYVMSYTLTSDDIKIKLQDYSCSGFTNEALLKDLGIIE